MIDYTQIESCLTGLVGYRNSDRTCIESVGQSGSSSGIYVTDVSGITPSLLQDARTTDYATTADYVADVVRSETVNAVQEFVNRHKELNRSRTLLDVVTLTKSHQRLTDEVQKIGGFVGYEIFPQKGETIAAVIKYFGFQLAVNQSVDVYLYETSSITPIAVQTVTYGGGRSIRWFEAESDFVARYRSNTGGTGQRYWLGYFENDITGNAINTTLDNGTGCSSCGDSVASWYTDMLQYVTVRGIIIPPSGLNGTDLPDITKASYTTQTYGMHLRLSVTCDITDVICDMKKLFAQVIKFRCAKRHFQDYMNSDRVNRGSDIARSNAETNIAIMHEEYENAMKSIKYDFTDIDGLCLPCNKQMIYRITGI